jgi:hypothetical protein
MILSDHWSHRSSFCQAIHSSCSEPLLARIIFQEIAPSREKEENRLKRLALKDRMRAGIPHVLSLLPRLSHCCHPLIHPDRHFQGLRLCGFLAPSLSGRRMILSFRNVIYSPCQLCHFIVLLVAVPSDTSRASLSSIAHFLPSPQVHNCPGNR